MAYQKQTWIDHIKDIAGNILTQGSPFNKKRMEHIEQGIFDAHEGLPTAAEKAKLSKIEDEANKYIHPAKHTADMIETTSQKRFISDILLQKINGINTDDYLKKNVDGMSSGHKAFHSKNVDGDYASASIELREANLVGQSQSDMKYAPMLAWHWSGRSQARLALNTQSDLMISRMNGAWGKVWHSENDGAGTDLDAGMLEGVRGINKLNVTCHTYTHTGLNPNTVIEPSEIRLRNMPNPPTGYDASNNDFILKIFRIADGTDWVEQELLDVRSNRKFTRRKIGGTWGPWSEIFHQNNYGMPENLTGSSITLSIGNANKVFSCIDSTAMTITIPPDVFAVGTQMTFIRYGTGNVTFATGTGVALHSIDNNRSIAEQFGIATIVYRGGNDWVLLGSLE